MLADEVEGQVGGVLRILMFWGLPDPDPSLFCTDPDPSMKQAKKLEKPTI